MASRIKLFNRYVFPITTSDGCRKYSVIADKHTKGLSSNDITASKIATVIPIYNGDRWGLMISGERPILATEFRYLAIFPERWGTNLFFVQDANSKKWGALRIESRCRDSLQPATIKISVLMPAIADDIYEDQMLTDCEPTVFWMIRCGNKVGILTPHGYTDINYDTYEDNPEDFSVKLIRKDGSSRLVQYSSSNRNVDNRL